MLLRHIASAACLVTLCALHGTSLLFGQSLPSSSFDHQYNGNAYPVPNYSEEGNWINPAFSNGTVLSYQSDASSETHYFSSNDWNPAPGAAWSFEMQYQVGTDGTAGALGAFAIDIGGSGTNDELILSIGPSSVSIFNGAPLDTNDNTGGLNTIRVSQPANSTEFLIWRDGVQIADLKQGIFTDPPTLYWGDPSGSNYGGPTIHVGYARWDDTGAYSPPGFLPGDLNHDGAVNAADYGIITSHWLQNVVGTSNGDLNSDGVVNLADFAQFKLDYQAANGGGSGASSVPEPGHCR